MPQFCAYYSMQLYDPGDPKGGAMAQWPPLNTPRAPNNNIDPGGPGPLNLIFANQFKRVTQVKIRIFILKVANSGPYVIFV